MWIPCWSRRISLLVLVSIHLSSSSLLVAQDDRIAPEKDTEATTSSETVEPSETTAPEAANDDANDSDWAVELAPDQFSGTPDPSWQLPELAAPAWNPDSTVDEVRADGSSLAEHAAVVNSLSSSAEIDTSMHTFYAVMAVLGLLAGGICCLQLSR